MQGRPGDDFPEARTLSGCIPEVWPKKSPRSWEAGVLGERPLVEWRVSLWSRHSGSLMSKTESSWERV